MGRYGPPIRGDQVFGLHDVQRAHLSASCAVVTLCALVFSLMPSTARAEAYPGALPDLRVARGNKNIAEAWLADPTTRYRHFVLGSQYEAASLVVRLTDGRSLKLTLPANSVLEDRQPRLADLDRDGADEIVVVRSYLDRGAALAVVSVRDGALSFVAETPPTGSPRTWLNPAGIADFDGDGRLDIAYVQMPHVLGLLRLWSLRDGKLVEIGQVPDVANHVAGSRHIGLSVVADFDGDGVPDLAIPTRDRRTLRFLSFRGGTREIGLKALPSPAEADFAVEYQSGRPAVLVGLGGGRKVQVGP